MMNTQPRTDSELLARLNEANNKLEALEAAKDAINYTLMRIRDDERIQCYMGFGTEVLDRLTTAQAKLHGINQEDVENEVLGDTVGGRGIVGKHRTAVSTKEAA